MEELISKINGIVDEQAKTLVGTLLKRIENLSLPEGQELTAIQLKTIYSNILKDSIYENSRILKKLIKINLDTGKIIFKSKDPTDLG